MTRPRSKRKYPEDYNYIPALWHMDHIPLLTTLDGVRGILVNSGVRTHDLGDFLRAIEQGGAYEPKSGPFKQLHRGREHIDSRLECVASSIRRASNYGVLWWNKVERSVWWVYSREDLDPERIANGAATTLDVIRRMFLTVPEVRSVRTECEAQPDTRRNHDWKEIHLRR